MEEEIDEFIRCLNEETKLSDLPLGKNRGGGGAPHARDDLRPTTPQPCLEDDPFIEVLRLLISRGKSLYERHPNPTFQFYPLPSFYPSCMAHTLYYTQPLANPPCPLVRASDVDSDPSIRHSDAGIVRRALVDQLLDADADPASRHEFTHTSLHRLFEKVPLDVLQYVARQYNMSIKSDRRVECEWLTIVRSYVSSGTSYAELPRSDKAALQRRVRLVLVSNFKSNRWFERHISSEGVELEIAMDLQLEHLALCQFMNRPVDVRAATRHLNNGSGSFVESYLAACKSELAELMGQRFHGDLTLFNVLVDSDASMRLYVQNEELVAAFRECCEVEPFIFYRAFVVGRFKHYLIDYQKREKEADWLCRRLSGADHQIVRVIAQYLSMIDLDMLASSCMIEMNANARGMRALF